MNDQVSETQTTDQANDLSLTDLAMMKSIIDVASERGTFKPNEMSAVGRVYDKLNNFLKVVEEQQKKAAEAAEAAGTDAATEDQLVGEE